MSDIPAARQILKTVERQLRCGVITKPDAARAIKASISLLKREKPVRRAPKAKRYVTKRLKAEILAYARQYPEAQMADIAEWFKVNQGRVSEILNGKR